MSKNNKHILQKTSIVVLAALICNALWGSAFPCIKIGYGLFHIASNDTASQMLFAGTRFFLAGVLTILIGSVLQKKLLRPRRESVPKILILCVFQTVVQYLLFYVSLAHTTAAKGAILDGMYVIFSLLITCFLFRQEKMTGGKLMGCIIGFIGVIVVNLSGTGMSMEFTLLGEGFMIMSACSCALSAVFMKHFSKSENPVMLSGYQFMLGGAILALVGKSCGGTLTGVGTLTAGPILLLIYMAMISAVAYSIQSVMLKHNPVSRITIFGFSNQIFGVVLSAIILRDTESIGPQVLLALALVCSGIFLVNKKPKEAP